MDTSLELSPSDLEPSRPAKPDRLGSLDVFRGITIAAMLLVNNPGGSAYAPLRHANWHGWTLTDLVFPFFLFIVGVAIPYSLASRAGGGHHSRGGLLAHIWLRALSIFMIGQLLTALPGWNVPAADESPSIRYARLLGYTLIVIGILGLMTLVRWRQTSIWVLATFMLGVLLLSIATTNNTLPAGYTTLKMLRVICCVFAYGGIMALLIPWPWKRVSTWLPVAIFVLFYVLLILMHFVKRGATDGGLTADLGGGMFNPLRLRIPGVLQRIGICYGVAATLALYAGWKTALAAIVVLCSVYSGLMLGVRCANHETGSLSKEDNLARIIDEAVLDKYVVKPDGKRELAYRHSYGQYPDNEGILSTVPAIATTLIGVLVGLWLRTSRVAADKCVALLAMGVLVTIVGQLLDWWLMPINKVIWTPSYAVLTAGLGMLTLGTIYWIVDLKGWKRWALPVTIFGMNSMAAFVFQTWVPRFAGIPRFPKNPANPDPRNTIGLIQYVQDHLIAGVHDASEKLQSLSTHLPVIDTPQNVSLTYAMVFVMTVMVLLGVMYLCRVFLKV